MATRTLSADKIGERAVAAVWTGLLNTDDGAAAEFYDFDDKTVQVTGTFGGGTLTIQGSNDGTNWATLSSMQGDALTFTAAGLEGIAELARYLRPIVSGGDGTTSLVCTMLCVGWRR